MRPWSQALPQAAAKSSHPQLACNNLIYLLERRQRSRSLHCNETLGEPYTFTSISITFHICADNGISNVVDYSYESTFSLIMNGLCQIICASIVLLMYHAQAILTKDKNVITRLAKDLWFHNHVHISISHCISGQWL